MKVKSILLTGLIAFIITACGDSVSVLPDILGENCPGCGEWEITIDATCTTAGEKARICTRETSHTGTQVIDPLGHDSGAWHSTAANCDALGTSVLRCTRCDHILGTDSTPSYGHNWDYWTVTTAPTCTTAGEQTRICSRNNSHTETQVIDPPGHDNGTWHSTASTCDELGASELRCTRCGLVLDADSTPSYGHNWDYWTVTTAATCTTAGKQTRTCLRDNSHTETQVIDPPGHDSGEWHSTASTCEKLGTSELRCTRCNSVIGTDSTLALGHSFGNWIITTLPTCMAEGVETRICSIDNYTETQLIAIVSTAHHWGDWLETTPAIGSENGIETRTCSHNTAHTETRPLINAAKPNITGHPSGGTYTQNAAANALTVAVDSPDGGVLSYKWHRNTTNSTSGGTLVGSNSSSCMPSTTTVGVFYYYVVVTNTNNGVNGAKTATATSNVVAVTVNTLVNAAAPIITVQPSGATYMRNVTASGLTVTAISPDSGTGGVLSYQWYSNTTNSNSGGTSLGTANGATASFTPSTATAGIFYYYVVVTNTNNSVNGAKTATATSNVAAVTVVESIEMVGLSAGTFTMGSPTTEPDHRSNETQHQVTLTQGFYMGKYEVTQEQYLAVMGTNPSSFSSSPAVGEEQLKRPVEMVSWYDAIVFCNKLSIIEGLTPVYSINSSTNPSVWGTVPTSIDAAWDAAVMDRGANGYRLPTEAEWEYACRAGSTTAFNTGWDGTTVENAPGWYLSNSGSKTHEVGLMAPNAWGLYDMLGNVSEWCWDRYGSSYYGSSPSDDPTGPSSGSVRILRGGHCFYDATFLRSARRSNYNPYGRYYARGFRVVRQ